jgi:hypothetical protein
MLSSIARRGGEQIQAYCVKCRAKREMRDARSITMKNGKPAAQEMCPVCGTKIEEMTRPLPRLSGTIIKLRR